MIDFHEKELDFSFMCSKPDDRQEAVDTFQNDKNCRIAVLSISLSFYVFSLELSTHAGNTFTNLC